MKAVVRPLVLFCFGGSIYVMIEIAWRGHTHWTMAVVGGLCFVLIGAINEVFTFEMPLLLQMAVGALMITLVEFCAGCILNLWLNLGIWDYSRMPFNIAGQICLPFSVGWFFLSAAGIILDDYLRYWLFAEEKPHYC